MRADVAELQSLSLADCPLCDGSDTSFSETYDARAGQPGNKDARKRVRSYGSY